MSSFKKEMLLLVLTVKKENTILLRSLKIKRKRAKLSLADRVFYSVIHHLSERISRHFTIIKPETVLTWTRKLIKKYWTFPSCKKKGGRPATPKEIKKLILMMKNENIQWGIKKIQRELMKVGISLDKKTISSILNDFRRRGKIRKSLSWSQFIKSHIHSLYAADFFTIDTVFNKRFYVFFILCLKTREMIQYAVTTNPCREFVRQQLIEFTEDLGKKIYLIHDRSPELCCFDYNDFNIYVITISVQAPKMNSFAERFIRSGRIRIRTDRNPLGTKLWIILFCLAKDKLRIFYRRI